MKTNKKEIYYYLDEYRLLREDKGRQYFGLTKNNLIINNINYTFNYRFETGKSFTIKKFSKYCVGIKIIEFIKCIKPFSYISKKKKKKNVKKN